MELQPAGGQVRRGGLLQGAVQDGRLLSTGDHKQHPAGRKDLG